MRSRRRVEHSDATEEHRLGPIVRNTTQTAERPILVPHRPESPQGRRVAVPKTTHILKLKWDRITSSTNPDAEARHHSTRPDSLHPCLYKVASTSGDDDDPFRVTAPSLPPEEAGAAKNAGSDSSSDVKMPGIDKILTDSPQQQQKRAPTSGGAPRGAEQDSDDDELDVVLDTMHSTSSVSEIEPWTSSHPHWHKTLGGPRLIKMKVPKHPDRALSPRGAPPYPHYQLAQEVHGGGCTARIRFLPCTREQCNGGRGRRSAGMTKAKLERMVLRSAEAQSEQLRREKEDERVRRGGRVVRVMEDVGEEKAQGHGVDDAGNSDDDGDDVDYVPTERGSASPRFIQSQGHGDDGEQLPAEAGERPYDDDKIVASAVVATDVGLETSI
ncbi:hypothetical protein BC826DRAFT_1189658 [Russula brevipes]|nr:hypothetical protein BC826DRAFT_1189658 [Russula brevipes]